MDAVPLTPNTIGSAGFLMAFIIPAVIFVLLAAVGARLAIRFEKWRERRTTSQ
jgi:hypothetical protein